MHFLIAVSLTLLLSAGAVRAQTGWTLAWADEFNGPAGAAVDSAKWGCAGARSAPSRGVST